MTTTLIEDTELLRQLQRARSFQLQGDLTAARQLLRSLSLSHAQVAHVWLMLATVAENTAEQTQALHQAVLLDPTNQAARRAFLRLLLLHPQPTPPKQPLVTDKTAIVEAEEALPVEDAEPVAVRTLPNRLWWAPIAALAMIVLIALVIWQPWSQSVPPTAAVATPALPTVNSAPPTQSTAMLPTQNATTLPAVTTPVPTPFLPTATPLSRATPVVPVATLPIVQLPTITPGQLVTSGVWRLTLLRSSDARMLDSAVAALQPRGQLVVILMTVAQTGATPTRMPSDLVVLTDQYGQQYRPLPGASTAYLEQFVRGQFGDLALEEPIPNGGGNVSVPLLFDVPTTDGQLYVQVDGNGSGWAIQP
jgi:hypothetical protein